jgi:putative component of toxin-antitoxin plasmid stabilization module
MIEVEQTSTYSQWFNNLRDKEAQVRINERIRRLLLANAGAWGRWEAESRSYA